MLVPTTCIAYLADDYFTSIRKIGGGCIDEKDKLSGIENYLKELFPGSVFENTWDSKFRRYMFHVDAPTGETKHIIGISSGFFGDNESEDIVTCLELYNLKGYLEMFKNKEVLVTNDGINSDGVRPSVMK